MTNFFRRFWKQGKNGQKAALSDAQACAIANAAVADTPYKDLMGMVKLENRDGHWTWIIGSTTIGSGMTVIIDDATGEITQREPWGVR
jgi:hypothetical protein